MCKGISYFLHRPRTANPSYHLYSHLVSCLTLSLSKCSPASPLTIRSQFPSHMPLFSSRITPSHHHLSVCYCNSSTLLLFFCYFLFPPFSHSFSPPLPLRFFSSSFFFLRLSAHYLREGNGLMNMDSPEQISLSICRCIPRSAPLIVSRKQSVY